MSHDATDACDGWDGSECEGTVHCPPRCPRFVDTAGGSVDDPARSQRGRRGPRGDVRGLRDGGPRAGLPPVTRSRRADWLETMLADGSNVVAERNGEPFGHAMYTPTDAARPELAVFVHPEMQGRGVGTELCRHVIADADAGDREGLELHVESGNRVARSVYRTVGFELADRRGPPDDPRPRRPDRDRGALAAARPRGTAESLPREPLPIEFDGVRVAGADD